MGLLDKVKAQATAATEMAKDAAAKGQAKLDEVQAKKAADGMLRDLGAAFYATKTGRSTPSTDADIEHLVAALQSHESEHGRPDLGPRVGGGRTDGDRHRRGGRPPRRRHRRRRDPARHRHPPPRRRRSEPAVRMVGARYPWWGRRAAVYAVLLRRGVEQSGSSSGS